MSTRAAHPYDAVNCAALPTALIESELFGHERGAFTDARERRIGIMEAADGGTILLDEVGALHVRHQAKLLTFLDSMTFKRVGGNRSITIDVRIISATSEDLAYAIRRRRFLDALYYRLAYSVIDIPPLAERRDEIPALVEYILQELQYSHPSKHSATIEADAMTYIQSQPLHGNIRELRYVVRRAARRAGARPISIDDLSFWHPGSIPEMTNGASPELATRQWGQQKRSQVRTIGQEVLIEVLRQEKGNKRAVARRLGMSPTTLYRLLTKYRLQHAAERVNGTDL